MFIKMLNQQIRQDFSVEKLWVGVEVLDTGLHQIISIENSVYAALGKLVKYLMETEEGETFTAPYLMEGEEGICIDKVDSKSYWCVLPYSEPEYRLMLARRKKE